MAGWRLRGYVVEQRLGRGASSEVWRARIAATGDAVALKRLFLTDAEQIKRARSEAALLTVLDHPNLVRLHDLVPTPDAAVLVLDLADGGSLADLLAARGRLTPGEVITAVAPVAAALAYVHRQGVVHGDVSPANLLFTPGGVALLADLGVARLTDDESDAESTPAYMDPAVAAGCVPAAASDVFMLGAVALHALTGAPLWSAGPGASPDDVVAVARRADVSAVEPRLVAAGVPDEMAAVVLRALTVEPTLRCSAADFALDLRHSGCPVAVELAAGRPRPEPAPSDDATTAPPLRTPQFGETTPKASGRPYGPRHAAPIGGDATPAGRARERVRPAATVAPPDASGHVAGAPAPTSAVRRPRPVIPRRPPRRITRRHAAVAGVVAAAIALAAAVVGLRAAVAPAESPGRQPVADRTDWAAALRTIDTVRAEAFAARDPALLARVYVAGTLRTADATVVLRLVPAGCSLVGAATRYTAVRIVAAQRRAVVTARASIPASVLRCRGRPDRHVGAVPATAVRIELSMTPAGPRIAALRTG